MIYQVKVMSLNYRRGQCYELFMCSALADSNIRWGTCQKALSVSQVIDRNPDQLYPAGRLLLSLVFFNTSWCVCVKLQCQRLLDTLFSIYILGESQGK